MAIDPQKLFLAALGILAMAVGWWLLAVVFYSSHVPDFEEYRNKENTELEEQSWKDFKVARNRWNLLHEMAGVLTDPPVVVDAADVAASLKEYNYLNGIQKSVHQLKNAVPIVFEARGPYIKVDSKTIPIKDAKGVKDLKDVKLSDVRIVSEADGNIELAGVAVTLENPKDVAAIRAALQYAKTLEQIRFELQTEKGSEIRTEKLAALQKYEALLVNPRIKKFGYLRTLPWSEERGPNPYLLVTGRAHPDQSHGIVNWLLTEQMPVLLEPLYKLMSPIKYWFDPAGGTLNRIYLFLVIVWMLIVWGIFGGAITRMAIVQVARNEKVGPAEAIRFVRSRIQSYVTAPLFPLVFLAGLAIFLFIFGLFEQIPLIGDILVAGLFWPVVLIFGLIMAVVLLGLIGWPLMYATLSAEGSDSFDAISRSYSYVFQATWSYFCYGVLAILYGAVLIFFVGFLSSVMVYMGKWGVSNANFWQSRDPSYLFMYAPTSFGWRDLLLDKSINAEAAPVILPSGNEVFRNQLKPDYTASLYWYNRLGAAMVAFWLTIFFMLVIGFGYSYFWTASSIIYLLMRQKVDDTEMDEIHMDDEEDAFTPPSYVPPEPKPEAAKPAQSVTMVESPTLRKTTPATTPPVSTPPASSPPASSSPPPANTSTPPAATPANSPSIPMESPAPARAPKTMLAPPEADPHQPPEGGAPKSNNGDEE